jgi:hypothetical protein
MNDEDEAGRLRRINAELLAACEAAPSMPLGGRDTDEFLDRYAEWLERRDAVIAKTLAVTPSSSTAGRS